MQIELAGLSACRRRVGRCNRKVRLGFSGRTTALPSNEIVDILDSAVYLVSEITVTDPDNWRPLKFDRALLRDTITIGSDALFGLIAGLGLVQRLHLVFRLGRNRKPDLCDAK